jgi:multidrug resistance efflux pump
MPVSQRQRISEEDAMAASGNHDSHDNPKATLRDRVQRLRLPEADMNGGSSRAWIPWTLCGILAFSTAALAVRGMSRGEEAKAKPAAADKIADSGDVALESKGYIIPAHQIQVGPKVGGMIMDLNVEEGRKVTEGETLAVIEKVNYQAAYDRAKATLALAEQKHKEMEKGYLADEKESAKAAWEEAKAQKEQLYLDWKRNINLKVGNALAQRDYELAESAFKAQERRVRKLELEYNLMVSGGAQYREERKAVALAERDQAKADLDLADWNLKNCIVKAPISGTILTKKVEKGNIINPVAFKVEASLCDMADLSDLEVDMTIQERDVKLVHQGQKCRVRSEAFPDRTYEGKVSRLMPIADRAKGAIPVRVKLLNVPKDEEGVFLKPEMGVTVFFLKGK